MCLCSQGNHRNQIIDWTTLYPEVCFLLVKTVTDTSMQPHTLLRLLPPAEMWTSSWRVTSSRCLYNKSLHDLLSLSLSCLFFSQKIRGQQGTVWIDVCFESSKQDGEVCAPQIFPISCHLTWQQLGSITAASFSSSSTLIWTFRRDGCTLTISINMGGKGTRGRSIAAWKILIHIRHKD